MGVRHGPQDGHVAILAGILGAACVSAAPTLPANLPPPTPMFVFLRSVEETASSTSSTAAAATTSAKQGSEDDTDSTMSRVRMFVQVMIPVVIVVTVCWFLPPMRRHRRRIQGPRHPSAVPNNTGDSFPTHLAYSARPGGFQPNPPAPSGQQVQQAGVHRTPSTRSLPVYQPAAGRDEVMLERTGLVAGAAGLGMTASQSTLAASTPPSPVLGTSVTAASSDEMHHPLEVQQHPLSDATPESPPLPPPGFADGASQSSVDSLPSAAVPTDQPPPYEVTALPSR